jgi:hypothetical protein
MSSVDDTGEEGGEKNGERSGSHYFADRVRPFASSERRPYRRNSSVLGRKNIYREMMMMMEGGGILYITWRLEGEGARSGRVIVTSWRRVGRGLDEEREVSDDSWHAVESRRGERGFSREDEREINSRGQSFSIGRVWLAVGRCWNDRRELEWPS